MPKFIQADYELRGEISRRFLSDEQIEAISKSRLQIETQLNWTAQLLGWNGGEYWSDLATTVAEKRRLLFGSFGVYGYLTFPKVKEARNWDFSIVVESDPVIKVGQILHCGGYNSEIVRIDEEEGNSLLYVEDNKQDIFSSLENNEQILIETPDNCPSPFNKKFVENFADYRFHCSSEGEDLKLYPLWDREETLPFIREPRIVRGSKIYFDNPVFLSKGADFESDPEEKPEYSFETGLWSINIPEDIGAEGFLISAELQARTKIFFTSWVNPTDWLSLERAKEFLGVWGNKGGLLPYSFLFDALGIHGFSIAEGVSLENIDVGIPFNELLNYVYYKRAEIGSTYSSAQVWWDPNSGSFFIWNGKEDACFPWVEVDLPNSPIIENPPEYVFPDQASFLSEKDNLPDGAYVEIADLRTVTPLSTITGISSDLIGKGFARAWKEEGGINWVASIFVYDNVVEFLKDADSLPMDTLVKIQDPIGLDGTKVVNLSITIDRAIEVSLIKDHRFDKWRLVPNSPLKFVGETRLFSSDGDEINGEIIKTGDRFSIYYFNRWVEVNNEWTLEGDWVDLTTGDNTDPPSTVVDYGSILVYCSGELITQGSSISNEDYFFSYDVNQTTGEFLFSYRAISDKGTAYLPKIEISDSVTSETTKDISDLVFSGKRYVVHPSVKDSMTQLKPYVEKPLLVCSSLEDALLNPEANYLRAGNNFGPANDDRKISIRLPFNYGRNSSEWNKANLICQGFTFGGSDIGAQKVAPPVLPQKVEVFEELHLRDRDVSKYQRVYSEPYLFSGLDVRKSFSDSPWNNSALLPGSNKIQGNWKPSRMIPYHPLNNRKVEEDGNWRGDYAQMFRCNESTGFFNRDISMGYGQIVEQPIWDASIYKAPELRSLTEDWDRDPNDFRVQYALFVAGQSVAGDSVYELNAG